MIQYQKAQYRELEGEYPATVTEVLAEENAFYRPDEKNSTRHVLTIAFDLTDSAGEVFNFTQRFVSPLTGGSGIFQALLDAIDYEPSEEGGDVDEQKLVFASVIVTIGKNKKGYDTIKSARKADDKKTKKKDVEDVFTE